MRIKYVIGDATQPAGDRPMIIVHVCNDEGKWGKGFVLALTKCWTKPEAEYRQWYKSGNDFALGKVQFVEVEDDLFVGNMVGQHGIRSENGIPPIRYDALEKCLMATCKKAQEIGASVHMPRIGAGLAGGDWQQIEHIIERTLSGQGIDVTVYDLANPLNGTSS